MRTFAVALAAGLIATAAGAQTLSEQPGTSETPSSPSGATDARGGMHGEMDRGESGRMGRGEGGRGDYARGDYARGDYARGDYARGDYGRGGYARGMGHHDMMRQHHSRGALFRISRGDTRIVVRCDGDEPMKACVEAATTLLDKVGAAR